MNIIEAAKLMKADKKMRRRSWAFKKSYIYMDCFEFFDKDGNKYVPGYDDLTADDWEVYEGTEYFDFFEAVRRLEDGKKVTNEWRASEYYCYHEGIIKCSGRYSSPIGYKEYNSKRWFEVE